MAEFEVGGLKYRSSKMNVIVQFHVARKIAPIALAVAAALDEEIDFSKMAETEPKDMLRFAVPAMEALGRMPDAEVEDILYPCLLVVERQQGPAWSRVMATRGALQFDDIDMLVMLQLVWGVLRENLSAFFPIVPLSSDAPPPTA